MAHFKKKSASSSQDIPLASTSDIIFILLIFFMVTTVFREIEVMVDVDFTRAENIEKIEQKRLVSYIYVGPQKLTGNQVGQTRIQIDDALIEDVSAVQNLMYDKLRAQPKLIVSLRIDADAEFGIVTDIQQELREAGALRINYSTKQETD
ncbi:MAG TPA: biopolymer transporter ExbD [Balneolaceae bacterium]|nr:biopolymer transporter ExbD [Balneolaceae bacterium]